ncbi:MAG: hypothetical protein EOR76_31080, partial [Mesorhizobium sp.]
APLCPAGHLPHLGGDRPSLRLSPMSNVDEQALSAKLLISPQVGEMSGRTEGGASLRHRRFCTVVTLYGRPAAR